ncbi:MAG: hypothetical protein HY211_00610 [Candidatus Omnitrophica bacterium]|nr:hypothetical protein [Candidatus Omnitrophota bacterium]
MRFKQVFYFRRFFSVLTILSFTLSQAFPACDRGSQELAAGNGAASSGRSQALRPGIEGRSQSGLEEAIKETASAPLTPASQSVSSENLSFKPRDLWIPLAVMENDLRGPVTQSVKAQENVFIVEGVFDGSRDLADGRVAIFPSPLLIDGSTASQVFDIVEKGKENPSEMSSLQAGIFDQVMDLARNESGASLTEHLAKEARAGRDASAAIAAAALQERGYFCGHFGWVGTEKPDYQPIQGIEKLEPAHLSPLFDLIQKNRLEDVLRQPGVYVAKEEDVVEKDGAVQVRLRPIQQEGVEGAPGEWITLDSQEIPLYQQFQDREKEIFELRRSLKYAMDKKQGIHGARRRLDAGRTSVAQARRALLLQVTRRLHGPRAVFRNHLLEDYLGGDAELDRFLEIASGFKRFDQYLRLFKNLNMQGELQRFVERLNVEIEKEEEILKGIKKAKRIRSASDLSIMRRRLGRLKDIVSAIEKETFGIIRDAQQLVRDPKTLKELLPRDLAGLSDTAVRELYSLSLTFRSTDRMMETRGRDSLGLTASFTFADEQAFQQFYKKVLSPRDQTQFKERQQIEDLVNNAIEVRKGSSPDGKEDPSKPVTVTFVYKTAMLVGRLGDNAARLTEQITQDRIFQQIIRQLDSQKMIHTRWASAGVISEGNAHPVGNKGIYTLSLNGQTRKVEMVMQISSDRIAPQYGKNGNIFADLNGDITNYNSWDLVAAQFFPNLRRQYEERSLDSGVIERTISDNIKTDTKVIPLIIEEFLARGDTMEEAFRKAIARFNGSFSIQCVSDLEPTKRFVALGGDGQGLYIGISEDGLIPASEVHGFIYRTRRFVKIEPVKVKEWGIERTVPVYVVIDKSKPPTVENIFLYRADNGKRIELTEDDIAVTENTARDVDLGDNRFFFIKEVFEAPEMFEATIEGRVDVQKNVATAKDEAVVNLSEDEIPEEVLHQIANGKLNKIRVIAMGTANAAGLIIARKWKRSIELANRYRQANGLPPVKIDVTGEVATETGMFDVPKDMSDTLIVAVTQSGGTKDTNVTLRKAMTQGPDGRGATVLVIVNKRDSDAVFIAQDSGGGVIYTGTGREPEIAVASTKAFYAQIGAGYTIGMKIAQALGLPKDDPALVGDARELLATPRKMAETLKTVPRYVPLPEENPAERERALAHPLVKAARFWPLRKGEKACLGDGFAYDSAEEVRIKNSELTYMAIGRDYMTHPKHINLSAEPWLLILAANIRGDDGSYWSKYVLQELEKFTAHRAAPIVVATENERDTYLLERGEPKFFVKRKRPNGTEMLPRPIDIITVPEAPEDFSPIYSAMAGHLFAYHTALAINEYAVLMGKIQQKELENWERLSKQEFKNREILENPSFRSAVREVFKPLWDDLADGVRLPGDNMQDMLVQLRDVYFALTGRMEFDWEEHFGREASLLEAFQTLTEQIRTELTRTIDSIRHQAKFVTVGIEAGGAVVAKELKDFAAKLVISRFQPGGQRLEPEVIQETLLQYIAYKKDNRPHVAVIHHPLEDRTMSHRIIIMKDRDGISGAAARAAMGKGAGIIEEAVLQVDKAIVIIQTLDKPYAVMEGEPAKASGLEEVHQPPRLTDLTLQYLSQVELGIGSGPWAEFGNWLVTNTGAMIGRPGTPLEVDLTNIDPTAVLEPGVRIVGKDAVVEAEARIGRGSYLENAKVRARAQVGAGSVLIYKPSPPDEIEQWRLSPKSPYLAQEQPTEVGEDSRLSPGTYLLNFSVGARTVWERFKTYPNIGQNGRLGADCRCTTAKLVLSDIPDGSVVGNFEGPFEEERVTGPIEVSNFVGRPGERLGRAGRSRNYYVEYVEGFSLPPMVVDHAGPEVHDRTYRELGFMSSRKIFGNHAIALEFSGSLQPEQTRLEKITGKEVSAHGIVAFGFGGIIGGTSKLIGVTDLWNRDDIQTAEDVLRRFDRTYLGHFAVVAPRGFVYEDAHHRSWRGTGEAWGRVGNFSLRGALTARQEVPAWVLDHAIDVVLTQMAEEFLDLQKRDSWNDPQVREQFNGFIQAAIRSEIVELRIDREKNQQEFDNLRKRPDSEEIRQRREEISTRLGIIDSGIIRLEEHLNSRAWVGEWRVRPEEGQPAFGSWWKENGRWVHHGEKDGRYIGYPDLQHTIEDLAAAQPDEEHPQQPWYPMMTDDDSEAILDLFQEPKQGSVAKDAVRGEGASVHPSAVIGSGAVIESGAVVGPGVHIAEGARIESGAQLAYSSVGRGARVGSKARAYGVLLLNRNVLEPESHTRLSIVGSQGEKDFSKVGSKSEVNLSKIQDGSKIGEENLVIGSMIVQGSNLGDRNKAIYGRLEDVQAGNNNTLNSLMRHVRWGNNIRNDHLATWIENEMVNPVLIRVPGKKPVRLHLPVTHGAYATVQGSQERPVEVLGSFLAGLTILEQGARLDRAFVKKRVSSEERLSPYTYGFDAGQAAKIFGGALQRPGPAFLFRFGLSYPWKGTLPEDRWAIGYLIEQGAIQTIERMTEQLSVVKPLRADRADAVRKLVELLTQRDFPQDGPTPARLRYELVDSQGKAIRALYEEMQEEKEHPSTPPASFLQLSRLQLLGGLYLAMGALDGRYRLRLDSEGKTLVFTEGVWNYDSGNGKYRWKGNLIPAGASAEPLPAAPSKHRKLRQIVIQLTEEFHKNGRIRFETEQFKNRSLVAIAGPKSHLLRLLDALMIPLGQRVSTHGFRSTDHVGVSFVVVSGVLSDSDRFAIQELIDRILPGSFVNLYEGTTLTPEEVDGLFGVYRDFQERKQAIVQPSTDPYSPEKSSVLLAVPADDARFEGVSQIISEVFGQWGVPVSTPIEKRYRPTPDSKEARLLYYTVKMSPANPQVDAAVHQIEAGLRDLEKLAGLEERAGHKEMVRQIQEFTSTHSGAEVSFSGGISPRTGQRVGPQVLSGADLTRWKIDDLVSAAETVSPDGKMALRFGGANGTKIQVLPSTDAGMEEVAANGSARPVDAEVLLRDKVRLESASSAVSWVGAIAGPHESGLAYGVALSAVKTPDRQQSLPVAFVVLNEKEADLVRKLAPSGTIFLVGSPEYPTVQIAVQKAEEWLVQIMEVKVPEELKLGTAGQPVSSLIQNLLRDIFGIEVTPESLEMWRGFIRDATLAFQA